MREGARKTEEFTRGFFTGGTLFEELGFYYVGPIDGHDLDHLLPVLKNVRDAKNGPILVHVVTQKGKGYGPAESSADKYHGVSKFDVITGAQAKAKANAPSYTSRLRRKPGRRKRATTRRSSPSTPPCRTAPASTSSARPSRPAPSTSASPSSTPSPSARASPRRATSPSPRSTRPSSSAPTTRSSTTSRSSSLPVRFAIDRAGFVGADGPTHAGSFDTGFLCPLPGMVVMAASDEAELRHMVRTAVDYDDGPISFRYPRGNGTGVEMPERGKALEIGRGRIVREGTKVAILSFGTRLADAVAAAEELETFGLSTTVADARFAKPLDARPRSRASPATTRC